MEEIVQFIQFGGSLVELTSKNIPPEWQKYINLYAIKTFIRENLTTEYALKAAVKELKSRGKFMSGDQYDLEKEAIHDAHAAYKEYFPLEMMVILLIAYMMIKRSINRSMLICFMTVIATVIWAGVSFGTHYVMTLYSWAPCMHPIISVALCIWNAVLALIGNSLLPPSDNDVLKAEIANQRVAFDELKTAVHELINARADDREIIEHNAARINEQDTEIRIMQDSINNNDNTHQVLLR
jgi:hypothetical protein